MVIVYVLLLAIILLKPQGLFGKKVVKKVCIMTDLNVKKEYLNLIYADCGKGSAGEKVKKRLAVPGTQYLIFGVILGVFPLLAQLGVLTSSFVFAVGNT